MANAGSTARTGIPDRHSPNQQNDSSPASQDEATRLRKLLALCSHLSALAAQDADLDSVVRVLSRGIGTSVAILDRELDLLASAGITEAEGVIGQLREHAGAAAVDRVLLAAAHHRRHLLIRSTRNAELIEDMRLLGTEQAAMVCGREHQQHHPDVHHLTAPVARAVVGSVSRNTIG